MNVAPTRVSITFGRICVFVAFILFLIAGLLAFGTLSGSASVLGLVAFGLASLALGHLVP